MKRAILLSRTKSIKIYQLIKKDSIFDISLPKQNINDGDIVYLCSYLEADYPNDERRNSMLSIVKCEIVSHDLTDNKEHCLYFTDNGKLRIKLKYLCSSKCIEHIFEFYTGAYFIDENTKYSGKRKQLDIIFNLNFE